MQLKKRVIGAVGRIEEYAAAIPPQNTIKANGAELSRVLFWRLFKHAQESGNLVDQSIKDKGQFGTGDGLTTFTIPDRRGLFSRAADDGAGVNPYSVALGESKQDQIKQHRHDVNFKNSGGSSAGSGLLRGVDTDGSSSTFMTTVGGLETNPKYSTALYCIRYQ